MQKRTPLGKWRASPCKIESRHGDLNKNVQERTPPLERGRRNQAEGVVVPVWLTKSNRHRGWRPPPPCEGLDRCCYTVESSTPDRRRGRDGKKKGKRPEEKSVGGCIFFL